MYIYIWLYVLHLCMYLLVLTLFIEIYRMRYVPSIEHYTSIKALKWLLCNNTFVMASIDIGADSKLFAGAMHNLIVNNYECVQHMTKI